MQNILLAIILVVTLASIVFVYLLSRKVQEIKDSQTNDKGLVMLNQNIQGVRESLDRTNESLGSRLDNAAKVVGAVQKELGIVQERFKGFEAFNDLLHPKLRGNIGEQILSDMLAQVFSKEHYATQYKFRDGQTVDAVIKTNAGIIPIDSKFPYENFHQLTNAKNDEERRIAAKEFGKAVKKHADDISKKYILPDEKTVNFAVMYVPSENIYYHMLTDEENDLMGYAKERNVLVTSPHGFFNFLRVVMMGLERSKLQEQAQKIWDVLKGVQQEAAKFDETLGVLAGHITRTKGAMDAAQSGYAKLTSRIDQVKLIE